MANRTPDPEDVILSPRPRDWCPYLESAPVASDAFMSGVEDLPVQALAIENWTLPGRRSRSTDDK